MFSQSCVKKFFDCCSLFSITPSKFLIGWGTRTALPVAPTYGDPDFYFPDFFLASATPWFAHEQTCILDSVSLIHQLSSPADFQSYVWHNPHKDFFIKTVQEIKTAIC